MGISPTEGFPEQLAGEPILVEVTQTSKLRGRALRAGVAVALTVTLAACSGGDGEDASPTTERRSTTTTGVETSSTTLAETSTTQPSTTVTTRGQQPVATSLPPRTTTTTREACAETSTWDTRPENNMDMTQHEYVGLSIGRHACFDRIAFVMNGGEPVAGYYAGYTDGGREVTSQGEGRPVPTEGPVAMEIVIRAPAQGVNPALEQQTGLPSVPNAGETVLPGDEFDYHGIENINHVAYAGSQHGDLSFAVGLTDEHDFRVGSFAAGDGSRHVVYVDIER